MRTRYVPLHAQRASTRRIVAVLALATTAVLGTSLVSDALIPPAAAGMDTTLYVDARIGSDTHDGREPTDALRTLGEAIRRAAPGTNILLTGYGDQLTYLGTGTRCPTVVGSVSRPVVIRRNSFTNTLRPVVLTTVRSVPGPWQRVDEGGTGDVGATWSAPWPHRIPLPVDPDFGFVRIGQIAVTGYAHRPAASKDEVAWWSDGRLYVRTSRANPNHYGVTVKDGDGICLSGGSRHVRIEDLTFNGAVHAVRVEAGGSDIKVSRVVRDNVLDADLVPSRSAP
ncbi:MAG TPA: hypothetical protein VE287_07255 [Actinopolymorphaceae bacterium]|nr:hypothetical protein [Actinopolymorphaceae bacterium]